MNITLNRELENFVNEKVNSGIYSSASEVIRDGLRLLKEQDELRRLRQDELRREIMIGVKASQEGRYTDYNSAEELVEDIKKQGLAELQRRREAK